MSHKISKTDASRQSVRSKSKSSISPGDISEGRESARLGTIKITLESCDNIRPFFPVADIQARCIFGDIVIGESRPVPITDAQTLSIEYTFEFQVDTKSARDMDGLVTYPAFLVFDQIQGTLDRHLYPQLQVNELIHTIIPVKSFDSIVSLYEALGPKVSLSDKFGSNGMEGSQLKKKGRISATKITGMSKGSLTKDRSKTKTKDSKIQIPKEKRSSVNSKSSISMRRNSRASIKPSICSSGPSTHYEPTVFGMCTIDFLPLLFGQQKISQSMLIKPIIQYQDEKMNSFKSHPKATITLWTEDDFEVKNPTFFNFTVESIYNIPTSIMTPDQDYRICCVLPMLNGQKMPMVFSNPVMSSVTVGGIRKCWPGIQRIDDDPNTTQYRTPDDLKDINAKFDPHFESYIQTESLRLQFAMIKRHLLLKESLEDITSHVKKYRRIVLEFFMSPKGQRTSEKRSSINQYDKTLELLIINKKRTVRPGPYLHLMALLDISTLLYPGVTRVRVGAPLTTFSLEEANRYGGIEESFFTTYMHSGVVGYDKKTSKIGKEGETSTKEDKTPKSDDHSLKNKLPCKPEEAVDPIQVYDEEGRPCFVVIEIELTNPLIQQKGIEDLTEDLSKLVIAKNRIPQNLSKVVLTSYMTVDHFKDVINAMVNDLNKKYLIYLNDKQQNAGENEEMHLNSFVEFLRKTGVYDSYVNSLSKVISMIINKKYQLNDDKNDKQYQKLIADIFVYLISRMNATVNKLICHGLEPPIDTQRVGKHFYYATEAMETGRQEMAERYLLERICNDSENADYWFNYTLFLLQIKEDDKAFECIKEALSKDMNHKYSLLTFGALLNNKDQNEEAETCFLNLMEKEFSWLEGWVVLYLFYLRSDNFEGMDMAMEMIKKYSELTANEQDEFMEADELVWTKAICPNTIFFRTAILLLKCRLYEWSELALSQEININPGLVHYLLSAICYYKKLYVHALDHIEETKKIYGPDYAVASLEGHCLLALDRKEEAKEQYYWAMEFFNRPVSMHLTCVQLANILDGFGEDQEARKLVLVACKYNPTPYTWMMAGKFYYRQNDLLSAEECFSEGNSIDNRYAEIWGYLALVNAKLKRASEAELCYNQAMRNKLKDDNLIQLIQNEMRLFCKNDFMQVY